MAKTVKKSCTSCGIQVAVACKTCPGCKNLFITPRRALELSGASGSSDDPAAGSRRRTERVKRVKPNYYDASEFEKKTTKKKRMERGTIGRGRPPKPAHLKKTKKKKSKSQNDSEEDLTAMLTPEKTLQCSIILAELNRKFSSSTWKA
ncbi:hypothetical protein LSTR_LSTR008219 [Laodelphax striatellus]|uniref:Uncharacterized protein n=2 Tax=Laodelphax striatellus TaxID=195883 RepID=A0A482WJA4_LAOST|nr:hypothetical protein LSTR_LSTR008219 [Laodelphax striatellus]